MNANDQAEDEADIPPLWRRVLARMNIGHWVLVSVGLLFVYGWISVTAANSPYVFQIPYRLLVGWWSYVHQVLPGVTVSWHVVIPSLAGLVIAVLVLHRVGCWMMARMDKPSPWSLKTTIAVTALLLVLAASAIAGTSIGHQISWLGRGPVKYDRSFPYSVRMQHYAHRMVIEAWKEDGRFVEHLESVVRDGFSDEEYKRRSIFRLYRDAEPEPWIYLGKGMTIDMPSHLPVIVSPRTVGSGRRIVAPVEGRAMFVDEADYQKLIAEWREEMRKREAKTAAK